MFKCTMRPGREVAVVDWSVSGALVETDRQLRPGSRVHIRLQIGDHSVAMSAHVVRCHVCALHPDRGVTYCGALHFDERCLALRDADSRVSEIGE